MPGDRRAPAPDRHGLSRPDPVEYPAYVAQSFLWYDLETFGRDPRWDRIAQFAAIRTDSDLKEVEDPVVFYGRISPDYLPDPEACMITGITPRTTADESGLVEAELARAINGIVSAPGTCAVGYNSLRFDDEFLRNLFYRNFIDPYRREYADGNSRWDVLPLVRLAHDLRPEGVEWIRDDQGKPVFKLDQLTVANGIEHGDAHDAPADVRATIAVARLIREKQPRLFEYYLTLRRKDVVRGMLNLERPTPVLFTDAVLTRPGGCTSAVLPLTVHPDNPNQIIAFDLREDPAPLWQLSVEEIRRLVFTSREELAGEARVPLVGIQVNRAPAVSPLSTLTTDRATVLGIDPDLAAERAGMIASRDDLPGRIRSVYKRDESGDSRREYADPDLGIYSGGFFGDADRRAFDRIHASDPKELAGNPPDFADSRGPEMLRRYLGRNYPDALGPEEYQRWLSHCARRLLAPEYGNALDYGRFRKKVNNLMARPDIPPRNRQVLKDLQDYAAWLDRNVLSGT